MGIELEILALLSPSGFEKRFHKHCQETKTYEDAYELTEEEYEKTLEKDAMLLMIAFELLRIEKIETKLHNHFVSFSYNCLF